MVEVVAITDTHTIKRYGHGSIYSVQNYHTLEQTVLDTDDANIFELELDNIFNTCHTDSEKDNKLDNLCLNYV